MVDPRSENTGGMRPEEQAALEALRRLPLQEAPPEAREAARRAFLAGEAGRDAAPSNSVPAGAAPPDSTSPNSTVAIVPAPRRGAPRFLVAALAAAATLFLLVLYGLRPAEPWRIREVVGPAGITFQHGGPLEPGSVVLPGTISVGPESEFELQLGDAMRIRLLAGTELTLPAPPGRWLGRTRALDVRAGEAYGTTSGPLGFAFQLHTPEATATLTGTSFAVIRAAEYTCFCLYRGHLDVVAGAEARPVALPVEHRALIFRDGRDPLVEPINARERMKLTMIDGAGVPPLEPR